MKKLLSLLMVISLLLTSLPVWAEETGLLDALFDGIEQFDPETDETLEVPASPAEKAAIQMKTDISIPLLSGCGITEFSQFGINERNTYLPTAAMILTAFDYLGLDYDYQYIDVYAGKNSHWQQWMVVVIDYTEDVVFQLWWTAGYSTIEMYYYGDDNGIFTVEEFWNSDSSDYLSNLNVLNISTIDAYADQLRGISMDSLDVGKATFEISSDKQSIYINRPSISGGSGNYTIAYNIYDSDSNAVNYFYSTESRVAATPGYGGLFNVFIVVTDTTTGESNTQNIGWQTLNWPYASKLTVGKLSYELSEDKMSIYLNRPSIACKSGKVTVAYNIYDSNSNPVNYFYSTFPRVAATPGYAGKFNVYVVVTDTGTGETVTQNIGWQQLGEETGSKYRGLIIVETAVPDSRETPELLWDMNNVAAVLRKVNGGKYTVTTRQDLTKSQVRVAISNAYSGAASGDVSFFFIGSHGIDQDLDSSLDAYEGAICVANSTTLDTCITLTELANWLSSANPNNEVVVVLSYCGSGAAVKGTESRQRQIIAARRAVSAFASVDPGIKVTEEEIGENGEALKRREFQRNKFYVLTASNVYESSVANPEVTASLMGEAIVKSMTISSGYMAADSNKDKKLTFNEWYSYVYNYCYSYQWNDNGSIWRQEVQRYPTSSDFVVFTN